MSFSVCFFVVVCCFQLNFEVEVLQRGGCDCAADDNDVVILFKSSMRGSYLGRGFLSSETLQKHFLSKLARINIRSPRKCADSKGSNGVPVVTPSLMLGQYYVIFR